MAQLLSKRLHGKVSVVQASVPMSDATLEFYHESFSTCSYTPEMSQKHLFGWFFY